MSIFMSVHLATVGPRLRSYIGAIHGMPKGGLIPIGLHIHRTLKEFYILSCYIQGIFKLDVNEGSKYAA